MKENVLIDFFRKHTEHIKNSWLHYGLETLVVIIGILGAIAVDNWNNNRKEEYIEESILSEISKGLKQDLIDIDSNVSGHYFGLQACDYFLKILNNEKVDNDSFGYQYQQLTRDFVSIFNTSGYESLKSRGLELIRNDSLRIEIISLYEQNYSSLIKLEEEYHEMQYQENYFRDINNLIAPYLVFNKKGDIDSIMLPLNLGENEKNLVLSYIWKIRRNRNFALLHYSNGKNKIEKLLVSLDKY